MTKPKNNKNKSKATQAKQDERLALNLLHAELFRSMMDFQMKNPGKLKVVLGPPTSAQGEMDKKDKSGLD